MDRPLETSKRVEIYLNDVSRGLRYMATEEATETRDELRQHIYALVGQLCVGGASEEDAITLALKKFGPANRVGLQLGSKSMQEFLRGLEVPPPAGNDRRWKWRTALTSLCMAPAPAAFSFAHHDLYWPYLIALFDGSVVGMLEGFDRQPVTSNGTVVREMLEYSTMKAFEQPRRRSLGAFLGRSLNAAMLRSLDSRLEINQLGAAYNPLTELNWKFFCRTAIWVMTLLLIPDGLGPLNPMLRLKFMLLWMTLWYAMVHVSSVATRAARRKIVTKV